MHVNDCQIFRQLFVNLIYKLVLYFSAHASPPSDETQRHYIGRLCKRMWMTTFYPYNIISGPTRKREKN